MLQGNVSQVRIEMITEVQNLMTLPTCKILQYFRCPFIINNAFLQLCHSVPCMRICLLIVDSVRRRGKLKRKILFEFTFFHLTQQRFYLIHRLFHLRRPFRNKAAVEWDIRKNIEHNMTISMPNTHLKGRDVSVKNLGFLAFTITTSKSSRQSSPTRKFIPLLLGDSSRARRNREQGTKKRMEFISKIENESHRAVSSS